jgi:DNA-binding LacI/PurR family transcriptional regulator
VNAVTDAINYLCSLGHIRIGFVTGLDDSDVGVDRYIGYSNALRSNGISEDAKLVYKGDYSFKTGAEAADYFLSLKKAPTAIMCANDTMAIGAIKEIKSRGYDVPEDISIIGFDDIVVASHMIPALTTVAAPVNKIAEQSVSMLDHAINGTDPNDRHIVIPARLIERSTCTQKIRSSMKKSGTR